MGMGAWRVDHKVSNNGVHNEKVCSPFYCVVSDDWGNIKFCPPQWWKRTVEDVNK